MIIITKPGYISPYFINNHNQEIDIEEKNKIEKLITEKYLYNEKVSKVNGFIGAFQNKYSRRPSQEEIFPNLKNEVGIPEIRIITEQIDSN